MLARCIIRTLLSPTTFDFEFEITMNNSQYRYAKLNYNHGDSPDHLSRDEDNCHTYQKVLCEARELYEDPCYD